MKSLADMSREELPDGLMLEPEKFVPQLVMTDEMKIVVKDVMRHWKIRDRFTDVKQYGIRPLDRVLFYGPPGNGKSMICAWMAKQMQVPMYRVVASQLRSSTFSGTVKSVANVCEWLNRQKKPALCLFDEAEALFIDRTKCKDNCDREVQLALTVFLQYLDRWNAPILLAMATNLPGQLDSALLSRIEMKVEFKKPTEEQSVKMIDYWAEILHAHGAAEWAPKIKEYVAENPPESFRDLKQMIDYYAREWIAKE